MYVCVYGVCVCVYGVCVHVCVCVCACACVCVCILSRAMEQYCATGAILKPLCLSKPSTLL